jgi:dTDP-4-dehydrorhamnose reductase
MRVAIVGAGGQLGQDICKVLGPGAIALTRKDADLNQLEKLKQTLVGLRPDLVINCAAYNFVDRAEREPAAAFAVNALGVQALVDCCRELDAVLVHFSTDYVFGQDRGRTAPYTETDLPGPTCVYGASKLAGETLAQLWPKHFVVRTCGLYGLAGRTSAKGNFVEMILRQAAEGKHLRVVTDQRCTPTASADLARAVILLVESGRFGLYHWTSAGDCTWFEFAQAILEMAGLDVAVQGVRTREFGSKVERPSYSVLATDRVVGLGLAKPRPWREALADYLTERKGTSS